MRTPMPRSTGLAGPRAACAPPSGRVWPDPLIRLMKVVIGVSSIPASVSAEAGALARGRGACPAAAHGERAHRRGDVAAARGDEPPLGAEAVAALAARHPRA